MEHKEYLWHSEVIEPAMAGTLDELLQTSVLTGFYLAGGTGLALHLGHRRSTDLDFFCAPSFSEEALLQNIQTLPEFALVAKAKDTLHAHIKGTKVSFLGFRYPVLFPFETFRETPVADPRDIACMKISAIAGRGTRRDFVDLYAVAQCHGLGHLLALFKQKFAQANYSIVHVLKSLIYFDEAEKDPMPDLLIPLSWEDVKQFFTKEAPRLL